YRLIKTKKNATPKNLVNQYNDGQLPQIKTQPINEALSFARYKFTEDLWYKHQYNTIYITTETILINCLPIFSYNGLYYIQNVMQNKTFNLTRFIVRYENPEIGIEYTIDIEKNGKKVSVYKKDLVGIIFKV